MQVANSNRHVIMLKNVRSGMIKISEYIYIYFNRLSCIKQTTISNYIYIYT